MLVGLITVAVDDVDYHHIANDVWSEIGFLQGARYESCLGSVHEDN